MNGLSDTSSFHSRQSFSRRQAELPPPGGEWQEAQDPNTGATFYWNSRSGATSWERPPSMPAPPAQKDLALPGARTAPADRMAGGAAAHLNMRGKNAEAERMKSQVRTTEEQFS